MVYLSSGGWGWWGRQPWENTIAYRPLKENIDDQMWNYSFTSWAATYSNNMATVTTDLKRDGTWFGSHSWVWYTISAWWKISNVADGWFWLRWDRNYSPNLMINFTTQSGLNRGLWLNIYSNWWKWYWVSWTLNNIHHVAWVYNWTKMTVYIDGAYSWEFNCGRPWAWWVAWDTMKVSVWCTMGETILEDKQRTADEVARYYNQTKSKYWL